MNKKLALLLAVIFIGTTALPVDTKKQPAPKKEKAPHKYTILVKNKLDKGIKVTITDTTGKVYTETLLLAKEKREVIKTTDKNLKIKSIKVTVGDITVTKEFIIPTRKAKIKQDKNGEIEIHRIWHKEKNKKEMKAKKDRKEMPEEKKK